MPNKFADEIATAPSLRVFYSKTKSKHGPSRAGDAGLFNAKSAKIFKMATQPVDVAHVDVTALFLMKICPLKNLRVLCVEN